MKRPLLTGVISLLLIFTISLVLINRFVEKQQIRSTQHWESTLSALADTQSLNLSRWMFATAAPLKEVSENSSVRLYLQRILQNKNTGPESAAQTDYLRNLITATANRESYIDKNRAAINANLQVTADSSLALYDQNHRLIAGTPGLSELNTELKQTLNQAKEQGRIVTSPIWLNTNQTTQISFITPIKALPNFGQDDQIIGYLIGTKSVEKELSSFLKNFSVEMQSLESFLLQADSDQLTFVSSLRTSKAAVFSKSIALNGNTASAEAFRNPGRFIDAEDFRGVGVLAVSRDIAESQLRLVVKIDKQEALGNSVKEQEQLHTILILGSLILLALLIGAGWYGHLIREQRANRELRATTDALQEKTALLNTINNNVTDMLLILDHDQQLLFINRAFAEKVAINATDSIGKNIHAVLGDFYAEQLRLPILDCIQAQTEQQIKKTMVLEGQERIFNIHLSAMQYGAAPAVMLHFHDITVMETHQQQQTSLLQQIMRSLMKAIDLHDPYSANHSAKTATLVTAITESMDLAQTDKAVAITAANLCNLGKLSLPSELLTKTSALTAEEQQLLGKESDFTTEILEGIEFDGPVLNTIINKGEYLDGSGRKGVSGDNLLIHTRILTAANDFIAMTSPRAYREGLSVKEALAALHAGAGNRYDSGVVAALHHVVENKLNVEDL